MFSFSLVISNAASFKDIEADWNWLAKYLLETLGKLKSYQHQLKLPLLKYCAAQKFYFNEYSQLILIYRTFMILTNKQSNKQK